MRGSSNIVSAIHSTRQAYEHFCSFQREYPNSKGAKLMETFNKKLSFIAREIITHPHIPQEVRDGVKKEWEGDVFSVDAIAEKVALLAEDKRSIVESIVDAMLAGEEIKIVDSNA